MPAGPAQEDPLDPTPEQQELMARAVALSEEAVRMGERPFGAVVARNGEIVGEGLNRVVTAIDPSAHAELEAIRAAAIALDTPWLDGCDVYSSGEPCPMCLAACYWARVERVYFANTKEDAAGIGFHVADIYDQLALPLVRRRLRMHNVDFPPAAAVFAAWSRDHPT